MDEKQLKRQYQQYYHSLVDSLNCDATYREFGIKGDGITGGYEGASGSMIGGLDDLTAQYDTTVSSKAKRELIRKLANGISKALKVSSPGASATNDDMVHHLLKIVPNPRKGKSIVADKKKQAKLCNDIADVVNRVYGKVIDKNLGLDGVCNQVADIVESLSAGLNQEYVAVAASVERSLNNLHELKNMLERSYTKLYNEAVNSDDESLKVNAKGIKSMHDLLLAEVQRQLSILSNLTRTNLSSSDQELSRILAENKDYKGLVHSIKASLGTTEWGDKLGFFLSGVNNVAQMAASVEKALKDIGMKASTYKNADKLSDLVLQTHRILESLPEKKNNRKYLDKFFKAVETLKVHHGHHSEIAKKIKGAYEGGIIAGGGSISGGRVTLKKKLKAQNSTRKRMLKDFKDKSKIIANRVYKAIFNVGKRIGTGKVVLNDDLYLLKNSLSALSGVFKADIEYALTGYYTHATAIEQKDQFMGKLNQLLLALEPLRSKDESFRDLASNTEALVKLVDFYQDKFHVHTGKVAAPVEGGGEFKAAVTLQNAINTFEHYYNVAKFKANLSRSAKELPKYSKNYLTMLGSAVGSKIDEIRSQYNADIKKLKDAEKLRLSNLGNRGPYGTPTQKAAAEDHEAALWILNQQLKAKEGLYKVAQAIDLYLQDFTDEIASSPEDIREVSKLLGSVELMANWFNEKSGNAVASLYELAPSTVKPNVIRAAAAGGPIALVDQNHIAQKEQFTNKVLGHNNVSQVADSKRAPRTTISNTEHYYQCIGFDKENVDPDKHQILGDSTESFESVKIAKLAHQFSQYASKKVYVLKNIVSVFAYLGKKYGNGKVGGGSGSSGTFLSPNQIYDYLMNYLSVSAFTRDIASGASALYNKYIDAFLKVTYTGPTAPAYSDHKDYLEDLRDTNNVLTSSRFEKTYSRDTIMNAIRNEHKAYISNVLFGMGTDDVDEINNLFLPFDRYVRATFSNDSVGATPSRPNFKFSRVSQSGNTDYNRSDFNEEDKVFVNIIKAMAAKVFTVTGLYNMLNYRNKDTVMGYALSPTRLIMGGAEGGTEGGYSYETPKIYPEAIELYARLPLLAEFYRSVFCYDSECDDGKHLNPASNANPTAVTDPYGENNLLISMVPEVGSLWAGLITTVFEQPANTNGLYTDNVTKKLIHEINNVYQVYKNKNSKSIVQDAVTDFVAEINNRYGLMMRGEINEYKEEDRRRRTNMDYGDEETPEDYDILDEDNLGTNVAPSDRYTKVSSLSSDVEHKLEDKVVRALNIFRRRIDARISQYLIRRTNPQKRATFPEGHSGRNARSYDNQYVDDRFLQTPFGRAWLAYAADPNSTRNQQELTNEWGNGHVFADTIFNNLPNIPNAAGNIPEFYKTPPTNIAIGREGFDKTDYRDNLPDLTRVVMSTRNEVKNQNSAEKQFKAVAKMMSGLDQVGSNLDQNVAVMFHESVVAPLAMLTAVCDILDRYSRALTPVARVGDWNHRFIPTEFYDVANDKLITAGAGGLEDVGINDAVAADGARGMLYIAIGAINSLSSSLGDLVEVQLRNKRIIVNHTKLEEICTDVFRTVKRNIDLFRGDVGNNVINNLFEQKRHGSVSWLQRNLFDELFNDLGQDESPQQRFGLKRAHLVASRILTRFAAVIGTDLRGFGAGHNNNIDETIRDMCYRVAINESRVVRGAVANNVLEYPPMTPANPLRYKFDHLFKRRSLATRPADPAGDPGNEALTAGQFYYINNDYDTLWNPNAAAIALGVPVGGPNTSRYLSLSYNQNLSRDSSSILQSFNHLMANYLDTYWDDSALKIYGPLLERVAAGPLHTEVYGNKSLAGPTSHNDTAAAAANGEYILFTSLAVAMHNALTAEYKGKKDNVIESIAEVSLRMKEIMKCNLPIHHNLFSLLKRRVELFRMFDQMDLFNGTQQRLRSFLDRVGTACDTMLSTISAVMNELNDAPLYLEVSENSITEYNDANNQYPFMPTSSMTALINSRNPAFTPGLGGGLGPGGAPDASKYHIGLPGYEGPSTDSFMFNYGTRLLLHDYSVRPLPEHNPGVAEILEVYNVSAESAKKLDAKAYNSFNSKCVELLRYLTTTKLYSRLFSASTYYMEYDGFTAPGRQGGYGLTPYQLNTPGIGLRQPQASLSQVLQLTTTTTKSNALDLIEQYIHNSSGRPENADRDAAMIYNILDLNISPINVHALRREIPLINMYNYAYTYDTFVTYMTESSYYGEHYSGNNLEVDYHDRQRGFPVTSQARYRNKRLVSSGFTNNQVSAIGNYVTTHDVLAAMSRNPYINVGGPVFWGKFTDLIAGNSSLQFYGRPKFISDQLWNKVLLQQAVPYSSTNIGRGRSVYAQGIRRNDLSNVDGKFGTNGIRGLIRNNVRPRLDGKAQSTINGVNHTYFTYRGPNNQYRIVRSVDANDPNGQRTRTIGKDRFDTKFIRNLIFLTNVQRLMMYKIGSELTKFRYPVISDVSVINRKLTDYNEAEVFEDLEVD